VEDRPQFELVTCLKRQRGNQALNMRPVSRLDALSVVQIEPEYVLADGAGRCRSVSDHIVVSLDQDKDVVRLPLRLHAFEHVLECGFIASVQHDFLQREARIQGRAKIVSGYSENGGNLWSVEDYLASRALGQGYPDNAVQRSVGESSIHRMIMSRRG
jgi:hypothetical protein